MGPTDRCMHQSKTNKQTNKQTRAIVPRTEEAEALELDAEQGGHAAEEEAAAGGAEALAAVASVLVAVFVCVAVGGGLDGAGMQAHG
jgi:hypothetical protein